MQSNDFDDMASRVQDLERQFPEESLSLGPKPHPIIRPKMSPALLSSKKQDWRTPKALLDKVREMGPIVLDPCASDDPAHHFATKNLTKSDDGLTDLWWPCVAGGDGLVFVNSEYGRALGDWVGKCADEASEDVCDIIQLVPNRPGPRWYRAAQDAATAMVGLDKRLTFVGAPTCAPFPSALFYYGPRPYLFCHVFQDDGDVRILR